MIHWSHYLSKYCDNCRYLLLNLRYCEGRTRVCKILTFVLNRAAAFQVLRILQNVTQGMDFLHSAQPPVLHGGLKAANVLIDRRFIAKISDFGLPSRRAGSTLCTDWGPFWTAPECLTGGPATVKSDVYSFGVLLYECLTRKEPFEDEDPEQILDGLSDGSKRLSTPDGCSPEMAALMDEALSLQPEARPAFSVFYKRLSKMDVRVVTSAAIAAPETIDTPSRRQRRTSACSNESAEATHQGSLSVMRSLFPRHVGDALIRGEKVPPERKEAITMYFSDVVGFTDISSAMPAEKVSDMLDRLYLRLDELADRLGVYKVETIGDAYLCATNILSDQAGSHAAIMARFALEALRAAAATSVDPDDPSKGCVRIRIGLNSGPCMASVVGRKNPKYTLFGDTINVASRMETSSRPGRVQCTARTAELIREQDPGAVRLQRRGLISVKGKQGLMETYWVLDHTQEPYDRSQPNSPPRALRPAAVPSPPVHPTPDWAVVFAGPLPPLPPPPLGAFKHSSHGPPPPAQKLPDILPRGCALATRVGGPWGPASSGRRLSAEDGPARPKPGPRRHSTAGTADAPALSSLPPPVAAFL